MALFKNLQERCTIDVLSRRIIPEMMRRAEHRENFNRGRFVGLASGRNEITRALKKIDEAR